MEALKSEVSNLRDRVVVMEEQQQKQERIRKYASDDRPTFRIKPITSSSVGYVELNERPIVKFDLHMNPDYAIYLYIEKEEYVIPVTEFHRMSVLYSRDLSSIRVEGDLVYLDLMCILCGMSGRRLYHFIIDYKNGNYICTDENVTVSGDKED